MHVVIDQLTDRIIVLISNIIKIRISVKDMKYYTILYLILTTITTTTTHNNTINNNTKINISIKMNMVMDHLDTYIGRRLLVLMMVDMLLVEMIIEDMKIDMIAVVHHRLDIVRQDHATIDQDHLIENLQLNHADINSNKKEFFIIFTIFNFISSAF
jgi:hypothetical protein